MVASSQGPIPASATAGDFARVIGVTERVVAGRKADGRLPKLPSGAIDLHAVIKAGVAALAYQRGRNSPDELDPAVAYDAGLRMAASVGARLAVAKALGTPLGEDTAGIAASTVIEACELFEIAGPER